MDRAAKSTAWLLERVAGVLFSILFLVTILNIVLRNVGGIVWLWTPGVTRTCFIWTVFLSAAVLYERNDHLVMDYFTSRLAAGRRAKIEVGLNVLFLLFLLALIVYGFMVARIRMGIPFETWDFRTGYAYLAAPVSGIIMLFFCMNKLRHLMQGDRSE